jgi:hypothetical protein
LRLSFEHEEIPTGVIAMSIHIVELQAISVAASVTESPKAWNPVVVAGALRKVVNGLFDPYRPELHYMRGPGPRWHERHAYEAAARPRR